MMIVPSQTRIVVVEEKSWFLKEKAIIVFGTREKINVIVIKFLNLMFVKPEA